MRKTNNALAGLARNGRAVVRYERAALSPEEAAEFAALAARGILEVESLAALAGGAALTFEVRGDGTISRARGRTVQLSAHRVRSRTAPYLHEIAHVLLPCTHAPEWFGEGLACYIEATVGELGGGYDSRLFTSDGNRGVVADAQQWLADPRGRAVLRFVGARGMPPGIVRDRMNVAAPFYVLSHALVQFLAAKTSIAFLARLARAKAFARELKRETGMTAAAWRSEWLETF